MIRPLTVFPLLLFYEDLHESNATAGGLLLAMVRALACQSDRAAGGNQSKRQSGNAGNPACTSVVSLTSETLRRGVWPAISGLGQLKTGSFTEGNFQRVVGVSCCHTWCHAANLALLAGA